MEDKVNIIKALKLRQATANSSMLFNECFRKCVNPSDTFNSTTQTCLENCFDRYRDTEKFLMERLVSDQKNQSKVPEEQQAN